jgi:hypothetical protein
MTDARWRTLLGHGGLLPFAGLALMAWVAPAAEARLAVSAQVGYGAVILAFVGALHWGRALAGASDAGAARALAWSVVPSLWGWVATLLAPRPGLLVLAVGLVLAWWVDRRLYAADRGRSWHPGFMRLRATLTTVATLALVATAAAPSSGP